MAGNPFPWPPFTLDMLWRPIKQVMAGGVFVCGGYTFEDIQTEGRIRWTIYRGDATGGNNATTWTRVFDRAQSQIYFPAAGAYGPVGADPAADPPMPGTPTFIMVGQENYFGTSSADPPFFAISILTSHDGESWSESFHEKDGYGLAAAWDDTNKRFLVDCVADMAPEGVFSLVVFASGNGSTWSRIETNPGVAGGGPQPSPLLMATGTPLVKDTAGNIVPNGSYYGKNANYMVIKPKILAPYYGAYDEAEPVASVEIIKVDPENGAITTGSASLPFPVSSVAYARGVYQACGSDEGPLGHIASSYDDGQTWKVDHTVHSGKAICVMAGPELDK